MLNVEVLTYLIMNKEVFNIFICSCIFMLDYKLTPAMFYLQIHRYTVSIIRKALKHESHDHLYVQISLHL